MAICQQRTGVEEFFYIGHDRPSTVVPRVWYQDNKGWYGEARLNYEEEQTVSLYGGKIFSRRDVVSFSFMPVAGLVWGQLKGGSLGANLTFDYRCFSFSSASQYTFSQQDPRSDFFFAWSELGAQVTESIYTGLALQQTRNFGEAVHWDPGLEIGFLIRGWTFPVYIFDPMGNNRHFVLGVTREWSRQQRPLRKH